MVSDQRFAASRTDVLVYETPVLQEDVTIAAFAALGVKVNITELDVDVLPRVQRQLSADVSATAATGADPYTAGLPDSPPPYPARIVLRMSLWPDRSDPNSPEAHFRVG